MAKLPIPTGALTATGELWSKMPGWLRTTLGLGAGAGVAANFSDNILGSVKNAAAPFVKPGGFLQGMFENAKQNEMFSSTTTGIRNLFVGIMEFAKIIGDLVTGKISIGDIMSGKTSPSEAFSSTQGKEQDEAALAAAGPNPNAPGGTSGPNLGSLGVPLAIAGTGAAVGGGWWAVNKFSGRGATPAAAMTSEELLEAAVKREAAEAAALKAGTTVGDDVARVGVSAAVKSEGRLAALAAKLPGPLKWLAVGLGVGGGVLLATSQEAHGATDPNVATPSATGDEQTTVTPTPETTDTMGAEMIGASVAAGVALKTGAKLTPLLSAGIYAADGLSDTYNLASQGKWEAAAVSTLANTGLTISGLGGGLTFGLGEAFHAAVRDSAIKVLGPDATIPKSQLRDLAETGIGMGMEALQAAYSTPFTANEQFALAADGKTIIPTNPMAVFDPNAGAAGITGPNANANQDMKLAM